MTPDPSAAPKPPEPLRFQPREGDELLSGARCAVHPDARATFTCKRCGNYGCLDCLFSDVEGARICKTCSAKGFGAGVPWERRKELGLWRAFWQTTRDVCFEPTRFFATPQTEQGVGGALLYGTLSYVFGQGVMALLMVLMLVGGGGLMALAGEGRDETNLIGGLLAGEGFCLGLVLLIQAPVQALIGILFATALSHVTLVVFKSAKGTFEQTLRAMCYSNAPQVFAIFSCISVFWMWAVEVIALRETHKVGTDRALLAVLGYRLFFIVLFVALYVLIFAAAFASAASQARDPYAY